MNRSQKTDIIKDLGKKMVFLCGPRQVGKTWLAKEIALNFKNSAYLNYDRFEDREIIKREGWLESTDLLILDEIHKMPEWKNYLKGIFDTKPSHLRILVTGSARLDTLRHAGDSLAGRFFRHRLLPFSVAEVGRSDRPDLADVDRLIERGGFPEPFLANDPVDADRWRMQYADGMVRTEVLDFERIGDVKALKLIVELLRRRVGSPISFLSISEDVALSPTTVKRYVSLLEALYIVFLVAPFSKNIARSLLKEPKVYFYDTGLVVGDEGARFENFIAISLLKHVFAVCDYQGRQAELRYIRTKDGEEIDFCVVVDEKPESIIETKVQAADLPPTLVKFHEKYRIPSILLVKSLKREQEMKGIALRRADKYLAELQP
jgi:predicted AAA+ superfamily ATPase